MYKVILLPEAEKSLEQIYYGDRSHFQRIKHAIDSLKVDPSQGKLLKNGLKGKLSLRVGFYRVIYSVDHKVVTVYIFDVGHRSGVYKR